MGVCAEEESRSGTGAAFLEAAFSLLDISGLGPGTGPGSRALTLGVTRPVHPTQQKCTGCSGGSRSSRGQRLPGPHSCHGLFCRNCTVSSHRAGDRSMELARLLGCFFWEKSSLFQG